MAKYLSDLEIANAANKKPIDEIANSIDIEKKDIISYGADKAKLSHNFVNSLSRNEDGKLILELLFHPLQLEKAKQLPVLV